MFEHSPAEHASLSALLGEPTLYDEFLRYLARRGYAVPAAVLERDVTQPYRLDEDLVEVFASVYAAPAEHWGVYETCEELVDIEDLFQQWRFRAPAGRLADHRAQAGDGWLQRGRLPAARARPDLLPRALRGARPRRVAAFEVTRWCEGPGHHLDPSGTAALEVTGRRRSARTSPRPVGSVRHTRRMPRVIHTAQALVDAVMEVPALPSRGGNVMATRYRPLRRGGGDDPARGGPLRRHCVHAGRWDRAQRRPGPRGPGGATAWRLSSPSVPDLDTGVCVVLVEPTAERSFVTTQGAERRITVESLAGIRAGARRPRLRQRVSCSGAHPRPAGRVAGHPGARRRRGARPRCHLRRSRARARDPVLARTSVWTGNADESAALSGVHGLHEATEVVATLLSRDAVTIVRDGARGCAVREGGNTDLLPGHPQRPVDANGAGDTHTGVLLAERAAGASWPHAAARANAAGAIKVTRRGPDTAPTRAEIDDFRRDDELLADVQVKPPSANGEDMVSTTPWSFGAAHGRMAQRARPASGAGAGSGIGNVFRRLQALPAGVALRGGAPPLLFAVSFATR